MVTATRNQASELRGVILLQLNMSSGRDAVRLLPPFNTQSDSGQDEQPTISQQTNSRVLKSTPKTVCAGHEQEPDPCQLGMHLGRSCHSRSHRTDTFPSCLSRCL